jgi:hypothetical protein
LRTGGLVLDQDAYGDEMRQTAIKASYLIAIALAMIGWLCLIGWIVMKLTYP